MRQHHTVHVRAPRKAVWALIRDTERLKEWVPEIVTFEVIEDRPGVGSRFRMAIKEGGRTNTYDGVVTEYEEGRLQVSDVTNSQGNMRMGFHLEDEGAGTSVTQTVEFELAGIAKLMTPLIKVMNRHFLRKQTKALAALVEAEHRSAASATQP